jgi:hypothetical protein
MARDISTINQTNLWGKQADEGLGLEPQRNDLYLVDFASALKNVATASKLQLAPIIPHYVRSITLPELRTKADPVRRDSNAYNMPSWDDPLDPVKLAFVLDTKDANDKSDVIQFLDAWLALTRAGRGSRNQGYSAPSNWLKLNSDFRVDFQFNVNVFLLRGANMTVGGFFNNNADDEAFRRAAVIANATFRNQQKRSGLVQMGQPVPESLDISVETATSYAAFDRGSAVEQDMVIHSIWVLKRAWLAAYKISDLNYTESALVTVEATFYADALELSEPSQLYGEARKVDQNQ